MLSLELYGDSYKISLSWNFMKQAYSTSSSFVPVIGEGLKTSQEDKGKEISEARVSNDLVLPDNCSAPGKALIEVFLKNGSGTAPDIELDTMVLSQYNEYSPCFVEIGEDKFYQLFQQKSRQASLYIKDYIYMDKVLKKVTDMGYVAISSYRVSAVEYDNDKVAERSVIIIKAFIVLLIVSVLEIIIIRSIFNLRCRDYNILKSMGMDHKTMKRMNYYEMLIYTAASVIIVVPAANFISLYPIRYLANIVKYYNMVHFTIYASINLAIIVVTVWSFNRYLRRKQKWSKYDTGK